MVTDLSPVVKFRRTGFVLSIMLATSLCGELSPLRGRLSRRSDALLWLPFGIDLADLMSGHFLMGCKALKTLAPTILLARI